MYQLFVRNAYEEETELTHSSYYAITDIDGFDPPEAVINTTRNAGYDGAIYNSAYMASRTVIITLAVNAPCAENRIRLYRYFKVKSKVRLRYVTVQRDLSVEGYVQAIDVAYFGKKQTVQITVYCPEPALSGDEKTVTLTNVESLFQFPVKFDAPIPMSNAIAINEYNIYNAGDLKTGFRVEIEATGTVVNPKIIDTNTLDMLSFNLTLADGDQLRIVTEQGKKGAWVNGVNEIGCINPGSKWLDLRPGDNVLLVLADSGDLNMRTSISLTEKFEGV